VVLVIKVVLVIPVVLVIQVIYHILVVPLRTARLNSESTGSYIKKCIIKHLKSLMQQAILQLKASSTSMFRFEL